MWDSIVGYRRQLDGNMYLKNETGGRGYIDGKLNEYATTRARGRTGECRITFSFKRNFFVFLKKLLGLLCDPR